MKKIVEHKIMVCGSAKRYYWNRKFDMILVVNLNASVDKKYVIDEFEKRVSNES